MAETHAFLIGGQKRHARETLEVRNPFNDEVVGEVSRPSAEHVDDGIRSAVTAFSETRSLPSYRRADILEKTASGIRNRKEDMARVLCQEAGKPIRHARGEVDRAICTLTLAAEEAKRMEGEAIPLDITPAAGNRLGIVRRFPIGPVAGISPFNFPLNLVCHKVAPALAAGNTIVLKPASSTPLSALMLGEVFTEAGAVPGSINVLPCSARDAGALVTDSRLKMVTFTGSAEVGWKIKAESGKKRVCLELGGNAALIIEPDADMKVAVERSVLGGYAYAGQICISLQRIYIHESVYDDFNEAFVHAVQKIKLGDPLLETTDVGPMIDEASAIQTDAWVREAVDAGARVLAGGERDGTLVQPTVLENVPRDAKVSCEEVFAPVVVLEKYATIEQAIDKVNDSRYGLQAGIFTRDIEKAFLAFNRIEAGGVIVNDIPTYRVDHMPYGGVKDSGFGREGVRYALEEMTELKIMVVKNAL